jgi:hypothetical protein
MLLGKTTLLVKMIYMLIARLLFPHHDGGQSFPVPEINHLSSYEAWLSAASLLSFLCTVHSLYLCISRWSNFNIDKPLIVGHVRNMLRRATEC